MAALSQKLFPKNNEMIRWLPPPANGWTQSRDIKPIAAKSFMQRWRSGEIKAIDSRQKSSSRQE
jgi:L-lactate dehydrogenase complex protein LldF